MDDNVKNVAAQGKTEPVILFRDAYVAVCVKPAGMLSTDEEGGLCEYVKRASNKKEVFVVHRLDRETSGLIVYALTKKAAAILTEQINDGSFRKEYFAVVHGAPEAAEGRMEDLLYHDSRTNKTFVTDRERKGVRRAELEYGVLAENGGATLVNVRLLTGRTHQIRVQFASRKLPLYGDRRYGSGKDKCDTALFSHKITFIHPKTGEKAEYTAVPEGSFPWTLFDGNAYGQ